MTILMFFFVIVNWNAMLERNLVGTRGDFGPVAEVTSYWAFGDANVFLLAISRMAHVESLMGGEARREVKPLHHCCAFRDLLYDVRLAF